MKVSLSIHTTRSPGNPVEYVPSEAAQPPRLAHPPPVLPNCRHASVQRWSSVALVTRGAGPLAPPSAHAPGVGVAAAALAAPTDNVVRTPATTAQRRQARTRTIISRPLPCCC